MKVRRTAFVALGAAAMAALSFIIFPSARALIADPAPRPQLSPPFTYQILATSAEAPLALRFFETAVKSDSQGRIITGQTGDPVKKIIGPEAAGERGGMPRFTKVMFGADYIDGRPDPGTRINPNNPVVKSGSQYWPNREQPFRSEPRALALTPDGRKLYVTLPGREGYPDWRVAVVDTAARKVSKWIDLRCRIRYCSSSAEARSCAPTTTGRAHECRGPHGQRSCAEERERIGNHDSTRAGLLHRRHKRCEHQHRHLAGGSVRSRSRLIETRDSNESPRSSLRGFFVQSSLSTPNALQSR